MLLKSTSHPHFQPKSVIASPTIMEISAVVEQPKLPNYMKSPPSSFRNKIGKFEMQSDAVTNLVSYLNKIIRTILSNLKRLFFSRL